MRILDLFCGAGGAAVGLHRAYPDAEILGVDIEPQPHYPYSFIQADAMTFGLSGFDLVWTSPPCQGYSRTRHSNAALFGPKDYPRLVERVRERLASISGSTMTVIENVPCAPLRNYVQLCGTMFGLNVVRHRRFECSPPIFFPPASCNHHKRTVRMGRTPSPRQFHCVVGNFGGEELARSAMGIDWMTKRELSQAIPPVYAEWIGRQFQEMTHPHQLGDALTVSAAGEELAVQ